MSEPKFKHLLEPLKIGNYVLKNRMCVSNSLPHFLQGPEKAALVNCTLLGSTEG